MQHCAIFTSSYYFEISIVYLIIFLAWRNNPPPEKLNIQNSVWHTFMPHRRTGLYGKQYPWQTGGKPAAGNPKLLVVTANCKQLPHNLRMSIALSAKVLLFQNRIFIFLPSKCPSVNSYSLSCKYIPLIFKLWVTMCTKIHELFIIFEDEWKRRFQHIVPILQKYIEFY